MNTTNHCPIKLRWDKKADGRESAYLDFYLRGRRKKEFIHLYRGGDLSAKESRQNERLALAILKKRTDDFNAGRSGITNSRDHRDFFQYFQQCADKRNHHTRLCWLNTLRHIRIFESRNTLCLSDIDADWCRSFYDYLTTSATSGAANRDKAIHNHHGCRAKQNASHLLSPNTAKNYFNKLRNCIHDAISEGIITEDPTRVIDRIKSREAHREYLSMDEVRLLMQTPFTNPVCCRAFLFSCFTGLRISDVRSINWSMVRHFNDFTRIDFSQTKTKGQMYLDIPPVAEQLMGQPEEATTPVFSGLPTTPSCNAILRKWVQSAGIQKHITFHCSRHTAAVSLLTADADLYTVSKILGHARISTTEIYAKIVDSKRQEAMTKLQNLFDSTDNIRTKLAKNG